ncbi:MAG: hypothetical protein M3010_13240, partial [Candidatus Dormibacteraeota bacterium]|nr:hypothetical protein [Candidatus Dormibacteraeota bacterium]
MIDHPTIAAGLPPVSVGAILRDSGPRLLRDSLGPITVFYAVFKLTHDQLLPAVVLAATVAIAAFAWERRHARAGFLARLSLGFVLVQAAV